jgi:hypothetical protein
MRHWNTGKTHMLYALLAYHAEAVIKALSPQEDDILMAALNGVHDRLVREGKLGPSARLGSTQGATTVRRGRRVTVTDGPFAETKEQLLGFYVLDVPDLDAAIAAADALGRVNPSAVYEIRPITVYLPGGLEPSAGG